MFHRPRIGFMTSPPECKWITPCSISEIVYATLDTPAARMRTMHRGQGRAMPRVPSFRTRATQISDPGVSFIVSRASAWASGWGNGAGPLEAETRMPSLRIPTAPNLNARRSDLRRPAPAAIINISVSDRFIRKTAPVHTYTATSCNPRMDHPTELLDGVLP